MCQKDYILRMVEMLAELITGLLGLIKKGISEKLLEEHHYSNGHLKVLSELFFAEAKLQEAEVKEKNARKYYEKSLTLLEFVERESTTFSLEIQSRIQELKYKIPRD